MAGIELSPEATLILVCWSVVVTWLIHVTTPAGGPDPEAGWGGWN